MRAAAPRAAVLVATSVLAAAALAGCAGPLGSRPAVSGASPTARAATTRPTVTATDPATVAALLHVAQIFNNNYDNGNFGAVYDRWDARSQALISRAEYIRRHQLCAPATHVTAQVEGAVRGPGGAWLVSYQISGANFVDTWYYVHHRWVFDIVRSNPSAARQYGMPFPQYARAVGCQGQ